MAQDKLVKDQYTRDLDGIRNTLLQIRASLRGASSAARSIKPMLNDAGEFADLANDAERHADIMLARYEATFTDCEQA